jgi:hypothetical protein
VLATTAPVQQAVLTQETLVPQAQTERVARPAATPGQAVIPTPALDRKAEEREVAVNKAVASRAAVSMDPPDRVAAAER